MKHVQELLTGTLVPQNASAKQPGNTSQTTERNKRKMAGLWSAMASMYGRLWEASYGTDVDPDRVWEAALAGLSEDQIKRGLRRLVEAGEQYPPTAPAFRKLCSDHWEHGRIQAADQEWARRRAMALEHEGTVEARRAEGRAAIDALVTLMGGKPKQKREQ